MTDLYAPWGAIRTRRQRRRFYRPCMLLLLLVSGCGPSASNAPTAAATPPAMVPAWTVTLPTTTSPEAMVVAGTTLVTADLQGTLAGFNLHDGTQRWSTTLKPQAYALIGTLDTLYAVSLSETLAIDPERGSTRWQTPIGGFQVAPTVVAGHVLINDTGGWHGLDIQTSQHTWTIPESSTTLLCGVSTSMLYYRSNTMINAVDAANGTLRWSTPYRGQCMTNGAVVLSMTDQPIQLHARAGETGVDIWTRDGVVLGMVLLEDTLYLLDSDGLWAFDAATGRQRWQSTAITERSGLVAITLNDQLYVYVSGNGSGFYALNRQDGSLIWARHDLPSIMLMPYLGFNDDQVYLWPESALLAINPADGSVVRTFTPSTERRLGTMGFVSAPVIDQDRMYLLSQSNREPSMIFALDIGP